MELAEQGFTIAARPIGQMGDEGLDLVAGGEVQGRGTAIGGGVGFDQGRIELMLAD